MPRTIQFLTHVFLSSNVFFFLPSLPLSWRYRVQGLQVINTRFIEKTLMLGHDPPPSPIILFVKIFSLRFLSKHNTRTNKIMETKELSFCNQLYFSNSILYLCNLKPLACIIINSQNKYPKF